MSKKPWRFEPEDFLGSRGQYAIFDIAEKANAKLDEWKREATVVLGASGDGEPITWYNENIKDSTHRALLINIEELPKEPCKHEPSYTPGKTLNYRDDGAFTIDMNSFCCRHCGVKLKSTWEAVE